MIITITDSIDMPTQADNLPLDVEYIRLIVVPILLILLFLIFLAVGIGVTVLCIRICVSSHQKKQKKLCQMPMVTATLDSLERTSAYNIYPPNPISGI